MKWTFYKKSWLLGLLICAAVCFLTARNAEAKKCSSFDEFAAAAGNLVKNSRPSSSCSASMEVWASKRLIVKAKRGFDPGKYAPEAVVEGPGRLLLLQFGTVAQVKAAYRKIISSGKIEYAEPDEYMPSAGKMASLSLGSLSYGSDVTGLARYARNLSVSTSRKVTVAVVDSGVSKHRLIRNRLLRGYDFVGMDTNPKDETGHGTHVAGIIADSTPTLNIRILPVRVLDDKGEGYNSIIGLGVRYAAEKGARVINLSVSGEHSAFLEECIHYAVMKGCVVCVSAGNQHRRMLSKEDCPGHMNGKGIITVGALTATLVRADFSNYGSGLDITAPGQRIRSTFLCGEFIDYDGTSMATPYVTAAAAIYKLEHPSYSPVKIKKMVLASTVDKGARGRDDYYGFGMLKMPAN